VATSVRLEEVSKSYNHNDVLVSVSAEIMPGTICGIVGESGSGKTTLLQAIVGFTSIDEGSIMLVGDESITNVHFDSHKLRRQIGISTQTPSLYHQLTVLENLRYFARLYRIPKKKLNERIDTLLSLVGLEESRNLLANKLSGGMLKRLDIALAIVHDPDVVLLDEPTADLDPILRRQLWQLIESIRDEGKTIIVSSHFLDEIDDHCDVVGILHKGRLVHFDSPEHILKEYPSQGSITIILGGDHATKLANYLEKRAKRLSCEVYVQSESCVEIVSSKPLDTVTAVTGFCRKNRVQVSDIIFKRNTLDVVFSKIIEGESHE